MSVYLSDFPYVEELNIAVKGDDIAELLEEELHHWAEPLSRRISSFSITEKVPS